MTRTTQEQRLAALLGKHPDLTSDGYACGHPAPMRGCLNLSCGDQIKNGRAHASLRLPRAGIAILAVAELIEPYGCTDRATKTSPDSYQLKHIAERCLIDHEVVRGYVANGEFIAAALFAGFPVKPCGGGSPNAFIGMSRPDLRNLEAEAVFLAQNGTRVTDGTREQA